MLLLAVLLFSLSWPQRSEARSNAEAAQFAYSEGYDLYQKGKFRQALRYFQRARQLAPKKGKFKRFRLFMLYFIGMCQYRLRQWKKSYRTLRRCQRSGLGRAAMVRQVQATLKKLKTRLKHPSTPRRKIRRKTPPRSQPRHRTPPRTTPPPSRPPPTREDAPSLRLPGLEQALNRQIEHEFRPRPRPRLRKTRRSPPRRLAHLPPRQKPSPPPRPFPVSYLLLGTGGAVFLAASILGIVALATDAQANQTFEKNLPQDNILASKVTGPKETARLESYFSYASFAVSAGLVAAGLTLLFLPSKKPPPPSPPRPRKKSSTTSHLQPGFLLP